MNMTDMGRCSRLIKTFIFAALVALSWPGMAQDNTVVPGETVAIEAEQVNINHADAETIARVLVGIGMSRAEAIVTYRDEFGEFTSLDDLMMVKGIGEVTLKNNEARIRFE